MVHWISSAASFNTKIFLSICDNVIVCFNFLHSQKPIGLISLLDEESNFPNGSDLTFANKLKQHLSANPCFKEERGGAFSIRHYAGEVN